MFPIASYVEAAGDSTRGPKPAASDERVVIEVLGDRLRVVHPLLDVADGIVRVGEVLSRARVPLCRGAASAGRDIVERTW